MRKIEFGLSLKINSKLSLNRIYGGIHWGIRKKQSQKIHEAVRLSLQAQNIPKELFKSPVDIVFRWNSKLDLDNHGYVAKLIIDGMKGYLLKDDSKKYINSITHEYLNQKSKSGVFVTISDRGEMSASKSNKIFARENSLL